jgi:ribosomal RNA-processing protein 7
MDLPLSPVEGAYGKTLGGGVAVADKKFVAEVSKGKRAKKKKEKREKETFYAFQVHEKRRKGARYAVVILFIFVLMPSSATLDLQAKFKQDVEKIAAQKAKRRFKPY